MRPGKRERAEMRAAFSRSLQVPHEPRYRAGRKTQPRSAYDNPMPRGKARVGWDYKGTRATVLHRRGCVRFV